MKQFLVLTTLLLTLSTLYSQNYEDILEFPDGTRHYKKESEEMIMWTNKDGKYSVDYILDLNDKDTIIVEFYEKPLCLHKAQFSLGKSSILNEHEAFKNQLQQVALSKSTGKKYSRDYKINHEFHKVFNGLAMECSKGMRNQIRNMPMVKNVYDEIKYKAHLTHSVSQIKADKVQQDLGYTGKGVVVGIIDTGIDYMHPALGGGIGEGYKVIGGYDFENDDSDPIDDEGHGTHVSGIVAGESDSIIGVAPDAQLLAVKVLDENGYGETSNIIRGIEYCYDPDNDPTTDDKVDVLNMSLGSFRTAPNPMDSIINTVSEAGILCVISAGNYGEYSSIGSPGTAREALTVGACDSDFELTGFSSRGPDPIYDQIKPEVVAPGDEIYSSVLNGQYERYSGTSMAAPHITGVAALIKEKYPNIASSDLKSLIVNNTTTIEGEDVYSVGNGCVDALKAIEDSLIINPGVISFGFADSRLDEWRDTATIVIKNNFDYTQYIQLNSGNMIGKHYSLLFSENEFTLSPGDEKEVTVEIVVPGSVPILDSPPYAYSDEILCISTSGTTSIPFGFVKSPILILEFDKYPEFVDMISKETDENYWWFDVESKKLRLRLPKGDYSFICRMMEDDTSKTYMVAKENIVVDDFSEYSITHRDAKFKVPQEVYDHNNNLIADDNNWLRLSYKYKLGTGGAIDYISELDTNWTLARDFRYDSTEYYLALIHESKGISKASDLDLPSGSKDIFPYHFHIEYPNADNFQINHCGIWIHTSHHAGWVPFQDEPQSKKIYLNSINNSFIEYNRPQCYSLSMVQVLDTSQYWWEKNNSIEYYSSKMRINNSGELDIFKTLYYTYHGPFEDDPYHDELIINQYKPNDSVIFKPDQGVNYPLFSRVFNGPRMEFINSEIISSSSGWTYGENGVPKLLDCHLYSNYSTMDSYGPHLLYEGRYWGYLGRTLFKDNHISNNDICKVRTITPQYSVVNQKGLSITENNFIYTSDNEYITDIPTLLSFQIKRDNKIVDYVLPKQNNYISFKLYDDKDNIKEVQVAIIQSNGVERSLPVTKMEDDEHYHVIIPDDLPREFIDVKLSMIDSIGYSTTFVASPAFYFGYPNGVKYESRMQLMKYELVNRENFPQYFSGLFPAEIGDTLKFQLKYQNVGNIPSEDICWELPENYFFRPVIQDIFFDESVEPNDSCFLDIQIVVKQPQTSDTTFAYFPEISWKNGDKQFHRTNSIFNTYIRMSEPEIVEEIFPEEYKLCNNYPNPFNPRTTIPFELVDDVKVKISIFDIQGRLVKTLVNGNYSKGYHSVYWEGIDQNGSSVSSGIYFYRLETDNGIFRNSKMVLLK